ncbi:MAG: DUF4125 family protein [Eubacterium sp.]|nr:DUF4125 family protein [Eubacterium sp.]MBR3276724.1 DUF4125 family protein [Eubacterium sp.]
MMTLEEKKMRLVEKEWECFQQVQNEGGRASCQDDRTTFFIMRKSQFVLWPENLIDSYTIDVDNAVFMGRNLLAEKYAWMMADTAPAKFEELKELLTMPTEKAQEAIDYIVPVQVKWMEEYAAKYPYIAAGNRVVHTSDERFGQTSYETYLRGELHTYSEKTLLLLADLCRRLDAEGTNMMLAIMTATMQEYGFADLDAAEATTKKYAVAGKNIG